MGGVRLQELNHVSLWKIIYCTQCLSYYMCSSMLSLKFLLYCKKHIANNEHRDQRMGQVVAYKRLKQSKIINRRTQKVVAVA